MHPGDGSVEVAIVNLVQWLRLAIETTGAVVIGIGVVASIIEFVRSLVPPQMESYNRIRLTLPRYLALALEFHPARTYSRPPSLLLGTKSKNWAR